MSRPRLAYLLKKFPRLSETFVLNEILAQEARGRPIHVFSRRRPDDEPRHPELARLRARVEILPSRREIDPWGVLFAEDQAPEALFSRLGPIVRQARRWRHPRFPGLVAEALHLLRRTASRAGASCPRGSTSSAARATASPLTPRTSSATPPIPRCSNGCFAAPGSW